MVINFEYITRELDQEEKNLVGLLIDGLSKRTKNNPIKGPAIVKAINKKGLTGKKLTEVRLRKMVHFIRENCMLPLIATSAGYYVTYNKSEIEKQILSLKQRANSINQAAEGLLIFLQ